MAKGNPRGIHTIDDLFKEDIRVVIANPDAASIGRSTNKMLLKSGQWESLEKTVTVLMPTAPVGHWFIRWCFLWLLLLLALFLFLKRSLNKSLDLDSF